LSLFFFLSFSFIFGQHHHLYSFPTRRSSDLDGRLVADVEDVQLAVGERLGLALRVAGLEVDLVEQRRLAPPVVVALDDGGVGGRSEEHTSELQSRENLVCRLLLEKKNLYKTN